MLSLSLLPDEYLSINNGQIIVHLIRVAGGRAHLRIEADRSVPIVRGALLEREGAARPRRPGESRATAGITFISGAMTGSGRCEPSSRVSTGWSKREKRRRPTFCGLN